MYRALRPKYVIPVHGEERHMSAHAGLATDAGLGAARVTNGDVLELDTSEPSVIGRVHTRAG